MRFLSSGSRLFGWFKFQTIYGRQRDPYMTRLVIGRLRFHYFHRGDNDPDPHDHIFDFWTFPVGRGYKEKFWGHRVPGSDLIGDYPTIRNVKPWRWHYRSANCVHLVLSEKPIFTIVWARPADKESWGFFRPWVDSNSKYRHYVPWKKYLGIE